jgi:hypothetical protein
MYRLRNTISRIAVALLLAHGVSGQHDARTATGRVVDPAGDPLADVAVCLVEAAGDRFVTREVRSTPAAQTGSDGRYAVELGDGVDESTHRLMFVATGRVHITTPLRQKDGWPVVLPRAHTMTGRVVDADGEPARHVRVEARDWLWQARYRAEAAGLSWLPTPHTAVRTDARGHFVIPGTMASGVQLVVGKARQRSNPVAIGAAIELRMPHSDHAHEYPRSRPHWRRPSAPGKRDGSRLLAGSTKLEKLPPCGLSIRLLDRAPKAIGALDLGGGRRRPVSEYFDTVAVADDGTFEIQAQPGERFVQLILPRPPGQGAPDIVDVGAVTITAEQDRLDLDLSAFLPLEIRGVVRADVPPGRMLVGASVERLQRGTFPGYARFTCALARLPLDGSFALQVPPGDCTIFVIDLWTGVVLHREPVRTYASGNRPTLSLEPRAGACELRVVGDVQRLSWLELRIPEEAWPSRIDGMRFLPNDLTKRIGCYIPPLTKNLHLYLPPCEALLWLVDDDRGELDRERGEARITVGHGETTTTQIQVPDRKHPD